MSNPLPLPGGAQVQNSPPLDASGNGVAQLGPQLPRQHWQLYNVAVKCSSNTKESVCNIFIGSSLNTATYAGGTFTGSTGDNIPLGGFDIQPGQFVFAQWVGGDTGATGTLTVFGTYTTGAPQSFLGAIGSFLNRLIPFFRAGNTTIIDFHGTRQYNGPPAADNLIYSDVISQFFDPFGNNVLAGPTDYGQGGFLGCACQQTPNGLIVYSNAAGAHESGAWNQIANLGVINFNTTPFWALYTAPVVIGNTARVTTHELELGGGDQTMAGVGVADAGGGSFDIEASTTITAHIGAVLLATIISTGINIPNAGAPHVGADRLGNAYLMNSAGKQAQLFANTVNNQGTLNVTDDDGITYDTERRTVYLTSDLTTAATTATGIFGINPTLVSGRKYRVRVWLSIVSAGATGSYTFALAGGATTSPPTRTGFGVRQAAVTAQNSTAGLASGGSASSSTIGWVEFHGTIQPSANAAYNVTVLVTAGASAITIHAGSFMEFEPMSL